MKPSAFVLSDAVTAIAILAILAGIVGADVSWQSNSSRRLENLRIATDMAELTLSYMQQGSWRPVAEKPDTIRVEPIAGDSDVPNSKWVRIVATRGGQTATLVGLVPDNAENGGGK